MMSVPVVKQPLPTSGGGATGPVGGGPVGAGPPTSQTPGKMVQSVPQPGSNTLPKNPNPGNQMGVPMGGHGVPQPGGMSQNLPNSNLMKMPPTASGMPMSMVANHTAAQSMVHQSLSGVGGAGTIAPLSLVQDHRPQSSNMQQLTPPAAHAHPTPPPPSSQRSPAPPAHSTPPPTTHPPQSIPPSSSNPLLGGSDKAKELVAGNKPTANGVQVQKAGESSGGSQQQMRKTPDGPVSLVINHSAPESMGTATSSISSSQQNQQTHSMPTSGGLQTSPAKPDSSVANHASNQPGKVGLSSAPVANKVSPSPSPVKDKAPPATPPKAPSASPAPKAPSTTATNETPGKSATTPQSVPAATTQGTPVKSSVAPSAPSPTKPAPATPAAAATSDSGVAAGAPEAVSASPKNSSTTPPEDTKASAVAVDATESETTDSKTPVAQEGEAAATPSTPEKEAKTNTPSSTTPSRGSKRKRAETKTAAPALGSSQAAAIAAASRTPNSKNKSQSDSTPAAGDSKKNEKGEEEDEEEEGRKPKRVRIRTQPYQSPLPEMAYLPKFTRTPTPKAQEDRLILFYKNEFLAVRNAEGGFYVCQTMQNIYKHSSRIRIRWLSQETAPTNEDGAKEANTDGEVYSPDFYDSTDFDCILTNLNLDRLERGKYRLPTVELERTQSILKRALDAEKGVGQKTPLTEEHPDGLDLSLYRDESQLKKRRNSRRKSGQTKTKNAEDKNSEEGKTAENKDHSDSSSSSEEEEQNDEEDVKKPKREKRVAPAKESATPSATTPRARREAGKRKADSEVKAKATPAKKRNSSSVRKRRSETPAAAPATPRATPARATRSPKSASAPSRKERSRVKENRKKPGKKA